jgi:hypothetical protein
VAGLAVPECFVCDTLALHILHTALPCSGVALLTIMCMPVCKLETARHKQPYQARPCTVSQAEQRIRRIAATSIPKLSQQSQRDLWNYTAPSVFHSIYAIQ